MRYLSATWLSSAGCSAWRRTSKAPSHLWSASARSRRCCCSCGACSLTKPPKLLWVEDLRFHLARALRVVGIGLVAVAWVSVIGSEAHQSSDTRAYAHVIPAILP